MESENMTYNNCQKTCICFFASVKETRFVHIFDQKKTDNNFLFLLFFFFLGGGGGGGGGSIYFYVYIPIIRTTYNSKLNL